MFNYCMSHKTFHISAKSRYKIQDKKMTWHCMRHYLNLISSYTDLDFSPATRSCMKVLSFHVSIFSPILCNKSYQTHIWLHCIGGFFNAQFMLSTKTLRVYGFQRVNSYTASMTILLFKFNIGRYCKSFFLVSQG